MKYFIAIALIAAVASAGILKPTDLDMTAPEMAEVQEIIAAINSPSTDPATAAALEQLLQQVLGIAEPAPIIVGPAFVDSYEPISVGPAIIDFPLPEGALTPTPVAPNPVAPSPVAPAPEASSPLVQIIVNVNQAQDAPVVGSPVVVDGIDSPQVPVTGVEGAILPSPVIVVEDAFKPEQVNVVDSLPAVPEPVVVAPIIVAPGIVGPEILN